MLIRRLRRSAFTLIELLVVIAIIYSCCFFYQLQFQSPDYAAQSALMYCLPAIVFGAIAFWWFAQGKKDE